MYFLFYHLKIRLTEKEIKSKVETKNYNVMIDGKNFFDQPIKNDKIIYDNI